MTLQGFIETYGYVAVFIGCFLEGETVLVLAGFAAHLGYLSLPSVISIAALAGFCGDETAFLLGRRYGPRLVARSPRLARAQPLILEKLTRHATWVVFMLRFAWGLRIASPLVIGATGLPAMRFALPNAAGAVVWAIVIGGAGYAFGAAFSGLIEHAKKYEAIAFGILAVLAITITWIGKVLRLFPLADRAREPRPSRR
jgi:membrane protein DedA with SNARE-associated domain